MKRIPASKLKARCYAVLTNVERTGQPVIVTKDGKPMVKIVPIEPDADDLFGFMAGEFKIAGDIESPVVPLKQWKITKTRPTSNRSRRSRG
jgi:prevent-host-death family protein